MEEEKIEEILRRLDAIEARLSRLESPMPLATPPAVPPPVVTPVRPAMVAPPPISTMPSDQTEYFFGAKVLPRAGAAVLVMMFVYLASIAYDRGLIGPQTIFGGVATLCLLLIGIGQWKRHEREDFGQILTGIGSCGLFIDFAAGHAVQNLYPGETLIILFLSLGLVNVLYGMWRSSRAFLAIGMVGGLVAALLPLQKSQVGISFDLYFLVLIPAALVAARNRWSDAALGVWVTGTLSILPIALTGVPRWDLAVWGLEGTGVICLAAYAWASRDGKDAPTLWAAAVLIFLSGIGAFAFRWGTLGAVHIAVYCAAAAAAISVLAASSRTRSVLQSGVAFTLLTIFPFGFGRDAALWILLLFGAGCVGISFLRWKGAALALAGVELVLAISQHVTMLAVGALSLPLECLSLAFISTIAIVAARQGRGFGDDAEVALSVPVVAALGRYAYLATVHIGWFEPTYAVTAGLLASSITALVFGFWRGLPGLRALSLAGFAVTTVKAVLVDLETAAPFVRVGLLFAVGTALLVGGFWYIRRSPGHVDEEPVDVEPIPGIPRP